MKIQKACSSCAIAVMFLQIASGQSFTNLNFERATIAPTPVGEYGDLFADPALTFPGWTVGNSTNGLTYVLYNNETIGSPAVDLMGPNFPNGPGYSPLQGSYSVLLQYANIPNLGLPTLSQTGLVPINARSINFLVSNNENAAALTLDGVNIPLVPISGGRLAGDISSFAGSVAQVTFSTSTSKPISNFAYLDDIQFSTLPVPEPSVYCLLSLFALLIACQKKQRCPAPPPTSPAP